MAIAAAVQRGAFVYLYDKDGIPLSVVPAGTGPQEGLKGFTSETVTVQRANSFTPMID
jgi:hypothetical protein